MIWSLISSVVKGFFTSLFGALRQRKIDQDKEHAVRMEIENESLKRKAEILEKEKNAKRPKSDNINDSIDRFK